ncbi:MAG: rhodanese-like domain-containing protein [Burkholderiales bacterium]
MQSTNFEQAKVFFAAKMAFTTGSFELSGMIGRGEEVNVVDVRAPNDYAQGHIPGAVNLPNGKWHTPQGLKKDRPNVVYCYSQTCHLAAAAALEFAAQDYPVMEMEGGFADWQAKNLPIES